MADSLLIIRKVEIVQMPKKTHQRLILTHNFTALIFCHQQMERLNWYCYTSDVKEAQHETPKDFPGNIVTEESQWEFCRQTQRKKLNIKHGTRKVSPCWNSNSQIAYIEQNQIFKQNQPHLEIHSCHLHLHFSSLAKGWNNYYSHISLCPSARFALFSFLSLLQEQFISCQIAYFLSKFMKIRHLNKD